MKQALILCFIASCYSWCFSEDGSTSVKFQHHAKSSWFPRMYFCEEGTCPYANRDIVCQYSCKTWTCDAMFSEYITFDAVTVKCDKCAQDGYYSITRCTLNYTTRPLSSMEIETRNFQLFLLEVTVVVLGAIIFVILPPFKATAANVVVVTFPQQRERSPARLPQKPVDTEAEFDQACVICQTNQRIHTAMPCGHVLFCHACSDTPIDRCFFCRQHVDKIVRIFP